LYAELIGQGYDDLQIIDSRKTLSKIIEPVNCKFGAPMGRNGTGKKPDNGKVMVSKVPMMDGYDMGGSYWGLPHNLYVEYTKDLKYIHFFRK